MATKPGVEEVGESPIVRIAREAIRPNGATVVLGGFLGGPYHQTSTNDEEGEYSFRLYSSLALDDYVEVQWDDIVWIENYATPTKDEAKPNDPKNLERTIMWVLDDAKVNVSGFVVGDIATRYMPQEDAVAALAQSRRQADALLAAGSTAGCGTSQPGCICIHRPGPVAE